MIMNPSVSEEPHVHGVIWVVVTDDHVRHVGRLEAGSGEGSRIADWDGAIPGSMTMTSPRRRRATPWT
jgi:hypothetical protein